MISCEGQKLNVYLFRSFSTYCNVSGQIDSSSIQYYERLDEYKNKSIVLSPTMKEGAKYYKFLYELESLVST